LPIFGFTHAVDKPLRAKASLKYDLREALVKDGSPFLDIQTTSPTGRRGSICSLLVSRLLLASLSVGLVAAFGVPSLAAALQTSSEHTYYGYVPPRIGEASYSWGGMAYDPSKPVDYGLLVILANRDGTQVRVYELPGLALIGEFRLNALERTVVRLPNASFFKVVANQPASVLLLSGGAVERNQASISTFFTSVEGGYVGKEFIFLDVHSVTLKGERGGVGTPPGLPYAVYALEDSDVTVWDENGTKVAEYTLKANKVREFAYDPFHAYRLTSTGRVMVQSFVVERPIFYPALEGGFVGRHFHGSGSVPESGNLNPERFFLFESLEGSKVALFDLDNRRRSLDLTVPSGGNATATSTEALHMAVESDKPILLMYRSHPHDAGVAYAGLRAGQTANLIFFEGESYLFTHEETVVTLDDMKLTLPPDGILSIPQGLHTLSATKNVLVETVHLAKVGPEGDDWGLVAFGQCLPSAQSLDITYEELRLRPVIEETPWLYYAAAAIAIVAVITVLWARRRPKR